MILSNLNIPYKSGYHNISIEGNIIKEIFPTRKGYESKSMSFEEAIAFPGMINMHDHLAFNLFPSLRTKTYVNYLDWSADIHRCFKPLIKEVLSIPIEARIAYGELKNLLNGFTTVCDHEENPGETARIGVFDQYNFIHSLAIQKNWKRKLLTTFNSKPWIIHLNEGYGHMVEKETQMLSTWNILKKKIIGVHGISLTPDQLVGLSGLVWCPFSNDFLYDRMPDIQMILPKIPIFFGSDSTVSSSPNLWEHFRLVKERGVDVSKLFHMVTELPGKHFSSLSQKGFIKQGYHADLVIARKKHKDFWKSFGSLGPSDILVVIKSGNIVAVQPEVLVEGSDLDLPEMRLLRAFDTDFYVDASITKPLESLTISFSPPFEIKLQ